jgi:hypothetical protein
MDIFEQTKLISFLSQKSTDAVLDAMCDVSERLEVNPVTSFCLVMSSVLSATVRQMLESRKNTNGDIRDISLVLDQCKSNLVPIVDKTFQALDVYAKTMFSDNPDEARLAMLKDRYQDRADEIDEYLSKYKKQ